MGNLPAPKCTITDIAKYKGTGIDMKFIPEGDTTKPDMIIVKFSNMSKEDATDYVSKIKSLGYKASVDVSNDNSILFSSPNLNFTYKISDKTGYITFLPNS